MQFSAETTKTTQVHANSEPTPQVFNQTQPRWFCMENCGYFSKTKL